MAYLTPTEVQLGPQGRLVIPVQLRRLLGFEPGDTLVACLENGRSTLEKREAIGAASRTALPGFRRARVWRPNR